MGNCQSWMRCLEPCSGCFKCRTYSIGTEGNELEALKPQPANDLPPAAADEPDAAEILPAPEFLTMALPKPPTVSAGADGETLKVVSVDPLIGENGKSHNTYDYELMERPEGANLVLRRGQPFHLLIKLNRAFRQSTDAVSFIFTVADAKMPSPSNGTLMGVPMLMMTDRNVSLGGWSARLIQAGQNSIRVQICTPATSIVGTWKIEVDTKTSTTREALSYTVDQPFYLLFNPWCKEDQVYMENESWRKEYVMTDSGLIWRGSYNRMRPCPWNFAQFEKDILECSIYLLSNVGKLTIAGRADPVRVTRAISAAVNSPDDRGVLEGNWSNDYSGGTAPTKWQGSMQILQQFWNTKMPVKFGQCWVFSGVTTSVCRALGIPSRSVTNFSSAHDTQGSLTIDTFIGDDGNVMEELNSDSIWNFHVWNEVWMLRPDLEPGDYGGWQAIDATPQEESDGLYRSGPCSLKAVKQGEVKKSYDTAFQFAEVNADKVYWKYKGPHQPLKLIDKRTDDIGLFVSTKAVGKFEREDITDLYKYKDNSPEEREAVLRALRQCENMFSRYYLNEDLEDVRFDFQLRDDIVIGSPFSVTVEVFNKNLAKDHHISVTLRVDSVLYTGKIKSLVKKETFERSIEAGSMDSITMSLSFDEYAPEISDQGAFNICCLASVTDTDFEFFAQDDFRVRKPDIAINAPKEVKLGEEFEVIVSLRNPLPVSLNKAKFIIEGVGLGVPHRIAIPGTIGPGQVTQTLVKMNANKVGQKTIAAKFYSKELNDVDGYFLIEVKEDRADEE